MKRVRIWGFTSKLLIAFLLVISLTVILMGLLLSGIEGFLLDDMESSMKSQLQSARVAIELSVSNSRVKNLNSLDAEDMAALQALAVKLGKQTKSRLIVTDREGGELADSEGPPSTARSLAQNQELQDAMTIGYGSTRRKDPDSRKATMYVSYPVMNGSAVLGALRISQPTSRVDKVLKSVRGRLWDSALITAGAAVILSVGLALVLARPIKKISRTATAFGAGDLDARSEVGGSSELADLSRSFDSMAERIESMVQEMRDLDTMKSDFVANVSHELKTPLTAINGLSQTLRDGAVDDEEVRQQFLTSITVESQRLLLMVSNLLNLASAERGALRADNEPFDVEDCVSEIVERFSPLRERRKVAVVVKPEGRPATALGDREMFGLAFSNVLDNAIKFSSPAGTVTVAWKRSDGFVLLDVTDEGPGINEESREKVFERFERGSAGGPARGSGLGLSIARMNLDAQGGSIEIGSTGKNGTTMVLRVPRADFDADQGDRTG
ncbi:MAG: sensor histidine kinase [Candidatus Geothermincolia bacterium]